MASRPKAPSAARRRRLSPQARRSELLDAALAVFARRGIGEARHAEIAVDAGASVPTVFFYFPTREALVDGVLDEVSRFFLEMAEQVHASSAPADEVILEHIRAFAASVEASPQHARIWLDWSTAVRDEVWQRYLRFIDRMLAIVERTLERGQREGTIAPRSDPEDQARLLVGSAHMLALMKFSGAGTEKLEHFFLTLMEAVIGHGRMSDSPLDQGRNSAHPRDIALAEPRKARDGTAGNPGVGKPGSAAVGTPRRSAVQKPRPSRQRTPR